MRHRKSGRQLNRNSTHRKAMFRNMTCSLVQHELIKTNAFTVIERERIEEILREVEFGETAFVDDQTAPGKGGMISVRLWPICVNDLARGEILSARRGGG